MNLLGIGTSIVECLRIRRLIEQHGEQFLLRIYTDREVSFCQARRHSTEHFAGHWAMKEAISRALGVDRRGGLVWTELEIRPDANGRPRVLVRGGAKDLARRLRVADMLVSTAHCRAYATGYAVAVKADAIHAPAGPSASPGAPGATDGEGPSVAPGAEG